MVREAVGVVDVSTLGKIDIQGPDAAEFLDFVYSNMFSTLKPGACATA
jgi:glycine cleavage system aminomethyltransferase T